MKFIKPIIAVLFIGGLTFWMFTTLSKNKEIIEEKAQIKDEVITNIPVRVAQVQNLAVDNSLNLTGTFEARRELSIIAEAQGRITQLNIEEGQLISKGQIVAKIDDTNIQAQLSSTKASMDKAKKDVERYERLVKAGAISQQQYEEVKLGYQNAQTNVTSIEQQLKYSTARSPMSGIVKELKVEQSSFATPGATIATIVDINQLKMVVKVGEQDIIKVKRGQKVEIKTDVYPDAMFKGVVKLISVQADAGRKYEVEIELANPKKTPLKPGMYGTVQITPTNNKKETALFVARKAIVGSVQSPSVFVVTADNSVIAKAVKVGDIVEDQVQILEGLAAGDVVVTSGQINLSNGKKIKVINSEEIAKKKEMTDTELTLK